MSVTARQQVRYSGWRRERQGRFFGLEGWQLVLLLVLVLPALAAFSGSRWWAGVQWLLLVVLPGAGLVAVPFRGRPAAGWLWAAVLGLWGRATGWSAFRSAVATGAGTDVDLAEPDLPGSLSRLRFHDGAPFGQSAVPVCVCFDPATNRWGATARLAHPGTSRVDGPTRDRYAAGLGAMLAAAASAEGVARIALQIRSVPDDGTARAAWVAHHQPTWAPAVAVAQGAAMESMMADSAVQFETFLTVAVDGDRIRKEAKEAGGGVSGRVRALYRRLQDVEAGLEGLGVSKVTWLDGQSLAAAVRTGFNPGDAGDLGRAAEDATHHPNTVTGLPWAAAGPANAPAPAPRSYVHDGYASASYTLLMPERPVLAGAMAALMRNHHPKARRALTMFYEPLPKREALKRAGSAVWADETALTMKSTKGFRASRSELRRARENATHEQALSDGHAAVRVAGAMAVTVPAGVPVEDHAASLEGSARRCGFVLRRLELAQDTGFVAAAIPVGIGMPSRSNR